MSWARVDDGWWCHPKVMGLSLPARGLWVSALSWSCAQRRPVVPESFLRMVGAGIEVAEELVAAGLWIEHNDGYEIHDWSEYQELTTSEKRAEAGRKGGLSRGNASKGQAKAKQTEAKDDLLPQANGQAGTHPGPTRPIPPPPDSQESSTTPDPNPARPVVDQPTLRRAIRLVAEAQAAHGIDPPALAATIRRRMDDPTDADRERIDELLAAGETPEDIAEGWPSPEVDPLTGYPTRDVAPETRPRLAEWTPPTVEVADPAVARAALAAARGRTPEPEEAAS